MSQQPTLTVEQYRALVQKQNEDKAKSKKNKFGAERVGGHASKKEHDRSNVLRLKEKAGLIFNLREQVRYTLIPAQRDAAGNVIEHQCVYVADFVYNLPDGTQVVEDTKGFRTPEYIIKRKLMLSVLGIRIKEL